MSHVLAIDLKIPASQLDAVEIALDELGARLDRDIASYTWYGRTVGDFTDPRFESMRAGGAEPGVCAHRISLKDAEKGDYTAGLVLNADGTYTPVWDSWGSGRKLDAALGFGGSKLKDHLGAELAMRTAQRQGQRVRKTIDASGDVLLDVFVD